jgi:hypothetical protein
MKSTILIISIILILVACSGQNINFSPPAPAVNTCDCFTELTTGIIDERLVPCLSKQISNIQHEIHETFHSDLSLRDAVSKHMMETSEHMIHSCDHCYHELDKMFASMYPAVEYSKITSENSLIQNFINEIAQSNSRKRSLIHKEIALPTQAIKLNERLAVINNLAINYS